MLRAMTLSLLAATNLGAQDFGQYGPTYPILEEDFLIYLQWKLTTLSQSGALEKHQKTLLRNAQDQIQTPTPVPGLTPTGRPRTHYVDPSLTLKKDIVLPDGHVLGRKGESFNPLSMKGLSKPLLLLDGTSEDQVAWARRQPKEAVWILVDGSPMTVSAQENRRVYFDQSGVFSRRWKVRHVPARITQDGLRLKVEEMVP